jgi:hypothetical protein
MRILKIALAQINQTNDLERNRQNIIRYGRMSVLRDICPVSFVATIGGWQPESCDCLESSGHFDVVDGKVYDGAEAM